MLPESRTAVAEALKGEGQELVDGPARGSRADLTDLEQRVSDGALAAMKGGKMMMQQQLPWPDVKLMVEEISSAMQLRISLFYQRKSLCYHFLFNISNLNSIDLSFNQFQGPISGFGNLASLQILDLSHNGISADISNFDKQLSGCVRNSLQVLNLANNALGGAVPDWIGELRNLKSLHLEDNLLCCLIPPSLGTLSSLSFLYLGNMLQGPIPESFGQLSELIVLDVGFNQLSGIVSDVHFSNVTKLEALLLSSNSLVLRFSSSWLPQFQLKNIHLGSCVLGPQFPAWLRTQRMFSTMDMSDANISAAVPDWFWNSSSRVYYFNLSHNHIRGVIPDTFTFKNAAIIDLQSNQFHGSLPRIGNGVRYLYLSDNSFSGDLRPILNNVTDLWSVSLSRNHISGTIPSSICEMQMLEVLDLSSNLLSGEIPRCSKVTTGLGFFSVLNLANNNLSGTIPQWIGTESFLGSLHLNNNSLHGGIPSLEKCTYLYILDLGENSLKGSIPPWIGESLTHLKMLRLRSNMLGGIIPDQLGLLSELQVLDLAGNNFAGTVPHWIANLSAMVSTDKRITEFFVTTASGNTVDYVGIELTAIYQESLLVTIKGRDLEYSNTLSLVMSTDLSANDLHGQIPDSITDLVGLQSLNLSGNSLKGSIPRKIGNLQQLESLDLSKNLLDGEIPSSISALNYLSYLNLSYNKLSGRIPVGNQMQTLTDPTIYAGNPDLCGTPLTKKCTGDEVPGSDEPVLDTRNSDESETLWCFIGMMIGFVVGFWTFWGILSLKKAWRISYFRLVDKISFSGLYYWVRSRQK
ncbi:receptor-like protein EIX2 [Musa acuminata AAA Group]|uniref:receptor-like protein EIX2 n=1 Tax=Musa acuminata AAA Group TaxID=214697 RepID=UPI0031D936CF